MIFILASWNGPILLINTEIVLWLMSVKIASLYGNQYRIYVTFNLGAVVTVTIICSDTVSACTCIKLAPIAWKKYWQHANILVQFDCKH